MESPSPDTGKPEIKCLSCGAKASLSNEDGAYCVGCMKLHILEKMFVQLAKLEGRRLE